VGDKKPQENNNNNNNNKYRNKLSARRCTHDDRWILFIQRQSGPMILSVYAETCRYREKPRKIYTKSDTEGKRGRAEHNAKQYGKIHKMSVSDIGRRQPIRY
jgi:hypothetical protein